MKKYPIAEMFDSVQGEGLYTGTRMFFVRLAGCSVGKPFPKERYVSDYPISGLPIYTEQCTLYDGRTFACDTDYRVHERLTTQEIMSRIPREVSRVCISGGEPLIHDLDELVSAIALIGVCHLETSGTIMLPRELRAYQDGKIKRLWVTVSPKKGMLPEMAKLADEIKLLVDENFDPDNLPITVVGHPLMYLQPVNDEFKINQQNLNRCYNLVKTRMPNARVSVQMHKVMNIQ